jgi:hypothetical protein
VPSSSIFQKVAQIFIYFILGTLVGALIFLFMYGLSMDRLLLKNRELESTVQELTLELNSSKTKEEELKSKQKLVIKKIEIEIVDTKDSQTDGFTESDLRDLLRHDLKFLIGMPLTKVADTSNTLRHLVNGRTYEINQQRIGIELEALIIYTTLKVHVSIKKIK